MRKFRFSLGLFTLGLFLFFGLFSASKKSFQDEIVEKNIQAIGGSDKIAEIENFSFRLGPSTYYIASDGQMKITVGKEPAIREVAVVNQDGVMKNSFNEITEISGIEKARIQCLARLYSGLFTLMNFRDELEFYGLKNFGPEKLYCLTTKIEDLDVSFYVDEEDSLIKRIVFKSYDPKRGKYEVNIDYGPYEEANGVKMPTSWFSSRVGGRGSEFQISDIKMNNKLEEGFLSKLDVNIGEVEVSSGVLKGNVIEFRTFRNNLYIITNWREKDVEKAGLKTKDSLIFLIDDMETEFVFYASGREVPPRSEFTKGARIMFLDRRRGNTYMIYFYATEFNQIADKLRPLLPIQVKKSK